MIGLLVSALRARPRRCLPLVGINDHSGNTTVGIARTGQCERTVLWPEERRNGTFSAA